MSTVLLASGIHGKRFALSHATIHLHQAESATEGAATDLEIMANEIVRLQTMLSEILAKHTGQSYDKIAHDSDRDFWLTAKAAAEYGLVDDILRPRIADDPIPDEASFSPS